MLTTNLEPVYGIMLAYFILGGKEKMSTEFYIGAVNNRNYSYFKWCF